MPPAYSHSGVNKFDGTCLLGDRIAWIWWGPFHQDRHSWKWSANGSLLPHLWVQGTPGKAAPVLQTPRSYGRWEHSGSSSSLPGVKATCKTNPSATFSNPDFWKIQLNLHKNANPGNELQRWFSILAIRHGSYGHHSTPGRKYEADKCSTLFLNTCFPVRIFARALSLHYKYSHQSQFPDAQCSQF